MQERQHGTHDAKTGERQRYYADDDDVDLNTLVQREKMATGVLAPLAVADVAQRASTIATMHATSSSRASLTCNAS